ncbi:MULTISPECIES: thermonuclease family protein [unclassified Methylobacterium]|jgi:endonuclease YncB( thermonuclease family)|uniref:thermonuclease family protein n=1 Tax=unclassified Methylobacterium TaxID=2615210 RepID=UPI0013528CD8|nr:nuclease [Methylobacterium sp. 2A]MWV23307.1 nuclease [Methylobacterium sp. 2A]
MTSSTSVEQEAEPARPALDDPGRHALRAAIRDEVARARPRPVAVRTLELLAEAACVPDEAGTGIRVLDRQGNLRHRDGTDAPMSLADLVAELRDRHPALFLPPEPEIEPAASAAEEPRDSALLTGAYEMKAATARFVGAQSERARSLAERSSEQGRVLAQNAAGRFATLRTRLRGRLARPAEAEGTAAPGTDAAAAWNSGPGRFGETLRDGLDRLRGRVGSGDGVDDGTHRQRRLLLGAAAGTLAAVIVAGLVLEGSGPDAPRPAAPAAPRTEAPNGAAPGGTAANAPANTPDTVTPPPETAGDAEPDTPLPPNAVAGQAQVIDTATLKVGGKVVHLFGVEWVRGGQAEELARYIGSRPVTCQPAPGSSTMNCLVDGRDLSEVVLFNGGGRASPEASPELVAAEDHARSERLGVWKR